MVRHRPAKQKDNAVAASTAAERTHWLRPLSCNARRPLKRNDAKATDDFTAAELAHCIDESTHVDGALTAHTGPNVAVQRPAQAGEARRSGSAATAGWA